MNLLNSRVFNILFDFYVYNQELYSEVYKVYRNHYEDSNLKMWIRSRIKYNLKPDRDGYIMSLLILAQKSIRFAGLDDVFFSYLENATVLYTDVLYYEPVPVQTLIYIFCMNYHAHTHDLLLLKSDFEQFYIYNDKPFINWAIPLEFHTGGIKWRCEYCQFNHQNQFRETFSNEQHGGMNQGR